MRRLSSRAIFLCALVLPVTAVAAGQRRCRANPDQSSVVFLGHRKPAAAPDRSGPAAAIVVNDTAYLVDFRRFNPAAAECWRVSGFKAREPHHELQHDANDRRRLADHLICAPATTQEVV